MVTKMCLTCLYFETLLCSRCGISKDGERELYTQKPMTNADRIRAMTDEELVHWIVEMKITGCPEDQISTMWCDDMSCVDCWLDWLKKECEP